MKDAGSPKRVVMLLGAGFSRSAGLPLSVELASSFKTYILQRADGKGPASLKLMHFYIEGGIRFQLGRRGLDPSAAVNIEQIAIAARHLLAREASPLAPFVGGWHPHLLSLLADEPRLLEEYIRCFYDHLRTELTCPEPAKIAYVERLGEIAADHRILDVFSLNYDCCVENALGPYCSRHPDVALVDGFSPHGWEPELFDDPPGDSRRINLYKIHGSLRWVNSPEFGLVHLDKMRADTAVELEGMDPHLVFGTDTKLTGDQPFFSLAHLFFERLRRADLLVVIGYSFADGYVNSIIAQCQRGNGDLRLMNVGPTADADISGQEGARSIKVDRALCGQAGTLMRDMTLETEIKDMLDAFSSGAPF